MRIRAITLSISIGLSLGIMISGAALAAEAPTAPTSDTEILVTPPAAVATPAPPTPSARPSPTPLVGPTVATPAPPTPTAAPTQAVPPAREKEATPSNPTTTSVPTVSPVALPVAIPAAPPVVEAPTSIVVENPTVATTPVTPNTNTVPQGVSLAKPKRTPCVQGKVKLHPKLRASVALEKNTISLDNLRPFMRKSFVFDNEKQFLKTPHVIAEDQNRVIGGVGNLIQVKGLTTKNESFYTIYRAGKAYEDPCTHECLGYEAIAVGTAELERFCGEVAELKVTTSLESIEIGARLLPSYASELPPRLTLRNAKRVPDGYILNVLEGVQQGGRNSVITISLGCRDGLKEGNFLDIYQTGKNIIDPLDTSSHPCKIKLCDTRIGRVLVYKTYEKISLALVIEATQPIYLLDKVKTP